MFILFKHPLRSNIANPDREAAYLASLEAAAEDGIQLTADLDLKEILAEFKEPLSYELFVRILFSCLLDADYLDTESHFDIQQSLLRKPAATVLELWDKLEKSQKNY